MESFSDHGSKHQKLFLQSDSVSARAVEQDDVVTGRIRAEVTVGDVSHGSRSLG